MQIIETKKDLSDFLVDGADNIVAQETLNSELCHSLNYFN